MRPGEPADWDLDGRALLRLQVFYSSNQVRPAGLDQDDRKSDDGPVRDRLAQRTATRRPSTLRPRGRLAERPLLPAADAPDGRVGYAPFIVTPRVSAQSRVAVVLSTNTWQAYNFRDENGDGWGDSWYVCDATRSVDLAAPVPRLRRSVPLPRLGPDFIAWLNRTGKRSSSSPTTTSTRSRRRPARAARTTSSSSPVTRSTRRSTPTTSSSAIATPAGTSCSSRRTTSSGRCGAGASCLTKVKLWRDLGRPEAALVGVQYARSNHGGGQEAYVVARDRPWVFAGTGLEDGDRFGRYGIEIDARTHSSPPGTQVLARSRTCSARDARRR